MPPDLKRNGSSEHCWFWGHACGRVNLRFLKIRFGPLYRDTMDFPRMQRRRWPHFPSMRFIGFWPFLPRRLSSSLLFWPALSAATALLGPGCSLAQSCSSISRARTCRGSAITITTEIQREPRGRFLEARPWEHRVMSRFLPMAVTSQDGILPGLCHWWLENDYLAIPWRGRVTRQSAESSTNRKLWGKAQRKSWNGLLVELQASPSPPPNGVSLWGIKASLLSCDAWISL